MLKKSRSFANKAILPLLAVILLALPYTLSAYKAADFNWSPPFLARDEKPSIIIIFDNSGSMLGRAYTGVFNASREYYGYFNPRSYYRYVTTTTRFVSDNSSTGNWNGNWLNWATMHRVDVARKVMGGGNYNTSNNCFEVVTQDTGNRVASFTFNAALYTDLNGTPNKRMTPHTSSITISHPNSQAYMTIAGTNYVMRVQDTLKEGVLQAYKDKARMALFIYDHDKGGRVQRHMSENATELNALINTINTVYPTTWTPLAETLFTVYGYIRQHAGYDSNWGPRYLTGDQSYGVSTTRDPFYFPSLGVDVHCTKQNVILITDGESTQDLNIPNTFSGEPIARRIVNPRIDYASSGTSYLIDVAHWGQTTDMRPDLPGNQTVDFYAVFAFGSGSTLLREAARHGKFKDSNGNNLPDVSSEYDINPPPSGDGIPDNYFEAETGQELETAIFQAFQLATATRASGTAAAVTSQTRSGEGAAYQALFFPPSSNAIAPPWSGQVHAFLLDSRGNMREDTNGNGRLDLDQDRVIQFAGNTIFAIVDNGDSIISALESGNATEINATSINFLWSSSPWLNTMTDSAAISQRTYTSSSTNRHIFTFIDRNNNMVADPGEVVPFTHTTADCNHPDNFCSYLTLYGDNSGAVSPALSPALSLAQLSAFAQRQINFIRGAEVGNATNLASSGINDIVRSRTFNGSPWRLGDIIYSSPTVVGKPAENYHLIYKDRTYEDFFKKYQNRRQMIYTGGNDGMLHAFNGGFYNATSLNSTSRGAFQLSWTGGETPHPLGSELWAYVPYNLLPHLKWLMDKDYGVNLHAAYVDLKPRIFDARVFFQSDGITPINNSTHPNGWGTVLVTGMRLGGAQIGVDINKDGTADKNATSAYIIMDITNPEDEPTLLGEITMPGQGFTTCYPTVMPMSKRNANTEADNKWYLVFGSGPALSTGVAARSKLGVETSDQSGRLFVLDLKALVAEKALKAINSSGAVVTGGSVFATTEPGSFVSDPVAVDLNIGPYTSVGEFAADVVYFGTVAGDQINGQGRIRRLLTNNIRTPSAPSHWTGNSTLINVGKPITSGPSVALDDSSPQNMWVYFGAGRFFNRDDIPQTSHMAFYGVKEPIYANGTESWATVTDGLFNSTDVTLDNGTCGGVNTQDCVRVYKGGALLTGSQPAGSWQNLLAAVALAPGWQIDFTAGYERVLGQAAVLGGAVVFTSYTPSNDVCSFEGSSKLWGLYYKTGTAFYRPILGATGTTFNTFIDLGQGMALTPNIHIGEKGSTAFIQSSTGAIETIKVENPESVRSGTLFWRENVN